MCRRAIVRPPATTFARGLTTAGLGPPDLTRARSQHSAYCRALERAGIRVTTLAPDAMHPDSTFVEDTAVLLKPKAIITRPGAPSRLGEVVGIEAELRRHYDVVCAIAAPGTVDGGDVCLAGDRAFIGLSARTNSAGADELAHLLQRDGFNATVIDIRSMPGLLHLKSGMSFLGGRRLAVAAVLFDHPALEGWERVRVAPGEEHAANCVWVNGRVLAAQPCPAFADRLAGLRYDVELLDVSEFAKMDGGLSCLSLRF